MTVPSEHPADTSAASYRFLRIELIRQPSRRVSMDVSPAYSLLLITEGDGSALLDSGGAYLQRGNCLLLAPGMSVRLEAGGEGLVLYRLLFDVLGASGSPALDELLRHSIMTCSALSSCMLMAEGLYSHQDEPDELERLENQIRFQTLLLAILRQFRLSRSDSALRQAVQQSVAYVQEHCGEPITIEQLAAITGTSRWRYTQVFKEMTGQLPIDYLNTVRIDKAQQLLLLTRDKLYDVAQAVGFSNEYYFNRKFKQMVKLTPGQYRSGCQSSTRIFAPFLEDHLLALGVVPAWQYSHRLWGRQEYLGLADVPAFDITTEDWSALSAVKPELIMLDDGHHRWRLEMCRRIAPVFKLPYPSEEWRVTLQAIGAILGRSDKAALALERFDDRLAEARSLLARRARQESVAVLRVTGGAVYLYGGGARGYTGPLLYGGLGFTRPELVRQLAAEERRISLTAEELARLDADHIFVVFEEDGEGAGRELLDSPLWQQLPAVRGGRVYEVDFLAWMNYGVLSHHRKIDDLLRVLG